MKRKISVVLILMFAMVSVFAFTAHAETEKSASASADFMSNYVWRGIKLSNSMVIQPSVAMSYGGYGANIWVNYDTGTDEHNETDITLNYANSVDTFSYDAGYIYYALDGSGDDEAGNDTQEFYLSLGVDVILAPSLTVYYDFDEGEGAFIVAAMGHSFELPKGFALDLGASASYNAENLVMGTDSDGEDFSAFYNGEISASLTIPVGKDISVAPMIAYSFPLSNDAEDAIEAMSDDADSDILYGGLNVSLSF